MKNIVRIALVSVALASGATAFAKGAKKEPNCEVGGKKEHVKDEKACTKKKGTWLATTAAAKPMDAAPAAKPVEAKPAATDTAPAATTETPAAP